MKTSTQTTNSAANPGSVEAIPAARLAQQRAAVRKGSWILLVIFLLTIPLANPWVRGDGVAYYAYLRAPLIQHNLNFEKDWELSNSSFRDGRVDAQGRVLADQYTATGHIDNHSSVGPAMLWAPFVVLAHLTVLAADRMGLAIPADGFSLPYREAMALATAFYGFLAVWLGFDLARRYFKRRWALLAAVGIWFASSLPVYMYFNPSWSHAPSAFTVALFVWYWHRTRLVRTWGQWLLLGAIGGLMLNAYYPNIVVLLLPAIELLVLYRGGDNSARRSWPVLTGKGLAFGAAVCLAFLPTLVTKKIVYGSFLASGYGEHWFWNSPALLKVCFSSNHGLFTWTPILLFAVAGLFLLYRHDRLLGIGLPVVFIGYLYLIGCYQDWNGVSSFGNRFFVSLTALFVVGLGAAIDCASTWRHARKHALGLAAALTLAFIIWNMGLIFQWGTQMIPARGPVAWDQVARNQYAAVPGRMAREIDSYLFRRGALMRQIDVQDLNQVKSAP